LTGLTLGGKKDRGEYSEKKNGEPSENYILGEAKKP